MHHRSVEIVIQCPSLDRLIDYLEGKRTAAQQRVIDDLTAKIATTDASLKAAVQENS